MHCLDLIVAQIFTHWLSLTEIGGNKCFWNSLGLLFLYVIGLDCIAITKKKEEVILNKVTCTELWMKLFQSVITVILILILLNQITFNACITTLWSLLQKRKFT